MAIIKAIEGRSVHQIQSGQVIVDLCSVVKELVENGLDAGATSIDIRFRGQGLESIEVQDNGEGISHENYGTIALKHYTSKLSTYADLGSLNTFGFRGEALSSLCALSKFIILTAQDGEAPRGTRLKFEPSGNLKETEVAACQKGTVVTVEDLFYNLPVRRKELEKNIKREYTRVLAILHAYACISTGVRFAVSNQMPKGKKTVVFSTKSNSTTRENLANVYGTKTLSALVALDLELELKPSKVTSQMVGNFSSTSDGISRKVQIHGHISKPVFGEGRQAPDRQVFFINARPCGLPQISKAFNEVYKEYNVTQSPFIFADLRMDTNAYDVNVSPDKRTILLHDQPALIESLKSSLTKLFEAQEQTVPQSQIPENRLPSYRPLSAYREDPTASSQRQITSAMEHRHGQPPHNDSSRAASVFTQSSTEISEEGNPQSLLQNFVERGLQERQSVLSKQKTAKKLRDTHKEDQHRDLEDREEAENVSGDDLVETPDESRAIQDFSARLENQRSKRAVELHQSLHLEEEDPIPSFQSTPQKLSPGIVQVAYDRTRPKRTQVEIASITVGGNTTTAIIGSPSMKKRRIDSSIRSNGASNSKPPRYSNGLKAFAAPGTQLDDSEDLRLEMEDDGSQKSVEDVTDDDSEVSVDLDVDEEESDYGSEAQNPSGSDSSEEFVDKDEKTRREEERVAKMVHQAEETAAWSTETNLTRASNAMEGFQRKDSTLSLELSVLTSITNIGSHLSKLTTRLLNFRGQKDDASTPRDSRDSSKSTAEERLALAISKSDFAKMRIIGQFNLGFILATRTTSAAQPFEDLFIIDQHASDEIYNFSCLSATTTLSPQPLAHPYSLRLTAIEEEIIIAHTSTTLAINGFVLHVDESGDKPVGERCTLIALPATKGTVFNTLDLEELVALLRDEPVPPPDSFQTGNHRHQGSNVIRPSKVRKLLAMRACRSSIMVGKELTKGRMKTVVRHMGEIDRPWNCPHGRPTMRHLAGLGSWTAWKEGDGSGQTDWRAYLETTRGDIGNEEGK